MGSLLGAATAMVEEYAGAAPAVVQNEAVIRIAGYLHDNDPARNRRFSDVLALSGAVSILAMFRVQTGHSDMKFWPFREKSEHRAADFGAALAQAYEALAGGAAGVDTAQTAAAEFSIGAWGRAFAVAEVSGIQIPAGVLEQIGRSSLALRGNFVADVTANPMTGPGPVASVFLGYRGLRRPEHLGVSRDLIRAFCAAHRYPGLRRNYPCAG